MPVSTRDTKGRDAGGSRVAMREAGSLSFLLSDHLGSNGVVADENGGRFSEVRFKPWGEDRYVYGTSPTSIRFTGQRLESSIGLYFYGARWCSGLGRFISADTIVPNPGDPVAFDRYAYARNNPVNLVDPSGHGYCDSQYAALGDEGIIFCPNLPSKNPSEVPSDFPLEKELWARYNSSGGYNAAIRDGYGYSLSQGKDFVSWLQQNNSGWWSEYMSGGEAEMWKFLIALAYAHEMSGAWSNTTLHNLMSQAFANKLGWLVDTYGTAGYYIFLGSMGTIRNRVEMTKDGTIDGKPFHFSDAYIKTAGIWDGSLRSNDPNAPFDFANSMPEKQPEELLTSVNDFAHACTNLIYGCDTTGIAGTLYVLASWSATDGVWNVAFIVSYSQWISWK